MIVLSVNVHEKVSFLKRQLSNFEEYVTDYVVILSCNDYMFNELKGLPLKNVVVNPEIINKRRFHGSLTRGIHSNMKLAKARWAFDYFVVLSSRNLFYNKLDASKLSHLPPILPEQPQDWWWPQMLKTRLAKFCLVKNGEFYKSPHEGVVFKHGVCMHLLQFLEQHPKIRMNLFRFECCVEEFALQTIANLGGEGCTHIGYGGVRTQKRVPTDPTLFVYKTLRV